MSEQAEVQAEKTKLLNEWRDEIHAWSKEKGFWVDDIQGGLYTVEIENFQLATKIALIHSELSEAWMGLVNGDMENFKEEIVDTAIRAFDLAGRLHIDLDNTLHMGIICVTCPVFRYWDWHTTLLEAHRLCSIALEALRAGGPELNYALSYLIGFCQEIIEHGTSISFDRQIENKMVVNRQRPHKHGKAF